MSHLVPEFIYQFSDAKMVAPNFLSLTQDERVIMGINQNTYATISGTNNIIKQSEEHYKETIIQNKELLESQKDIGEKQLNAFRDLDTSLIYGFNDVNSKLNDLNHSIDISLTALIDQQIICNTNINKLIDIIKIPEFEKERLYYFSQGINYLKQALINKNRYTDAIQNLYKAYELDHKDYIISHQLGLIYLYNDNYIDLQKAEKYLTESVDYGFSNNDKYTAITCQHLAYCQLLQFKFKEAINNCKLAYKLDASIYEAKIIEIECEFLLGNISVVYELITKLCDNDITFISQLKENVILNKDFNIIEYINIIENKFNEKLATLYHKLKNYKVYFDYYYEFDYMNIKSNGSNLFSIIDNYHVGFNTCYYTLYDTNTLYEYFYNLINTNDIKNKQNNFKLLLEIIDFIELEFKNEFRTIDNALKSYNQKIENKRDFIKEFRNKIESNNISKIDNTDNTFIFIMIGMLLSSFIYLITDNTYFGIFTIMLFVYYIYNKFIKNNEKIN